MKNALIALILVLVLFVGYTQYSNAPSQEELGASEEISDSANETDESVVDIAPVSHASFVLTLGETVIFNDPVGDAAQYTAFGAPDLILVSDIHGDHFNLETLGALAGPETTIIAPQVVFDELAEGLSAQTMVMANDDTITLNDITITAFPMYNLPDRGIEIRHENGRGNGYVLEYKDEKIYIAGDTADIPEMRALTGITKAFVPMNLPYTMSVEDAADAVIEFAPAMVYPYHYRTPDGKSDVARFKVLVEAGNDAVEVIQLDWYPASE